jgi:hypothetical protein
MACRRLLRQTAFPMNPMLLTTHSSASPSNSAQRGEALLFVRIRLFGISAHSR